jgi:TRAP-type C4-dicarboxylate transport system permease large subunit
LLTWQAEHYPDLCANPMPIAVQLEIDPIRLGIDMLLNMAID